MVRLGIDFGTTRTVVACADRGNHPVVDFVDEQGDARGWIPSVVAERDGELRFGYDAVAVADDPSFTFVRSFKRLMSGAQADPGQRATIGGTTLPMTDLVTRFLVHVREALVTRSTLKRELAAQGADLRRRRRSGQRIRGAAPRDARRLSPRGVLGERGRQRTLRRRVRIYAQAPQYTHVSARRRGRL